MKLPQQKSLPKPTAAEMEILSVLWRDGAATVRQVHDSLDASRGIGYTTVLKFMQIMTEKGLVEREEAGRAHVYRAALDQSEARRQALDDILDKVFGGSSAQLALSALSARRATKEELNQVREWLDQQKGASR
jgi:BlaI family penicillinase repressor